MKTNLVTPSVWLWLSRDILRSCKKIWRRTPPMSLKSSGLLSCQTSILGSMIHHWQLRKWKSTFAISTTISLLSVSSSSRPTTLLFTTTVKLWNSLVRFQNDFFRPYYYEITVWKFFYENIRNNILKITEYLGVRRFTKFFPEYWIYVVK